MEAKFGRQATSFDFYFETISGHKIHFEIKYTERKFGKASINLNKFKSVYSNFLQPLNPKFHRPKNFFDNYQILRNLIHIGDNSFVVFVYPKDNEEINYAANRVKTEFLTKSFHDRFFSATWEKLFESVLISATNNTWLKIQLTDFKNKYLFTNNIN